MVIVLGEIGLPETLVRVEQVTLSYASGTSPELEGVDLELHRGEILSLVGPSGCGKSTLLRLIAGVLKPTAGEIRIGNRRAFPGWPGLGFVPQDSLLFPWRTVLANVRLPLELKGKMPEDAMNRLARAALNLVNLDQADLKYPHQLSGGMRQRAALARALVSAVCHGAVFADAAFNNISDAKTVGGNIFGSIFGNSIIPQDPEDTRITPVLLLDEPFASLDEITRTQLHLELLRIQSQTGATILLVTHNLFEAVFMSDRILVMGEKPGRILGEIPVDLPKPRHIGLVGTPDFSRLAGMVQTMLGQAFMESGEEQVGGGSVVPN